jgi:antitoxin VapB
MGLNIKNPETYRLVKELAEATGLSMTAAVTEAVRQQLARIRLDATDNEEERTQRILDFVAEMRRRFPPGYLDQDFDDLLYDEKGLPK